MLNRGQVELNIHQKIEYHDQDQTDEWILNCQGQRIDLNSYSRITYRDQEDVEIQVKWSPIANQNQYLLEIKMPQYKLVFHPNQRTQAIYPTSEGVFQLEVKTDKLEITDSKIHVSYRLSNQDQAMGKYDFQLQYV